MAGERPTAGSAGVDAKTAQSPVPPDFEQVYADLEHYFFLQLLSPTYESVDYTLEDGAEQSLIFDIADTGIDELLDGSEIQIPISKTHVPDSGFIGLSDTDQGRIIRFGVTFWGKSAQPDENFGIELNLTETDGTIGIFENREHEKKLIPLLRAATSDLNVTLALALVSTVATHILSVKTVGIKDYLSRFFSWNPINLFIGILEVISEATKIVSLSFRLFGNIFAGEIVLLTVSGIFAFLPMRCSCFVSMR